jgi:hypothetical protein
MTQTRFTCTLTQADEPVCQSNARATIIDAQGTAAGHVLATLWPPSTAPPAPGLTGPTPRAPTSGNARPWSWPKSEASSASPAPGTLTMLASPSPGTPPTKPAFRSPTARADETLATLRHVEAPHERRLRIL